MILVDIERRSRQITSEKAVSHNLRGPVLCRFPDIENNNWETVSVGGREGCVGDRERVRVGDRGRERLGELLACREFGKFKQIFAIVEWGIPWTRDERGGGSWGVERVICTVEPWKGMIPLKGYRSAACWPPLVSSARAWHSSSKFECGSVELLCQASLSPQFSEERRNNKFEKKQMTSNQKNQKTKNKNLIRVAITTPPWPFLTACWSGVWLNSSATVAVCCCQGFPSEQRLHHPLTTTHCAQPTRELLSPTQSFRLIQIIQYHNLPPLPN